MTHNILTGISIRNNMYVPAHIAKVFAMTEDIVATRMRMDVLVRKIHFVSCIVQHGAKL